MKNLPGAGYCLELHGTKSLRIAETAALGLAGQLQNPHRIRVVIAEFLGRIVVLDDEAAKRAASFRTNCENLMLTFSGMVTKQ